MNRLESNLLAVNGGVDVALLVGKDEIYPYAGGKRLDTPTGTKLTVVLQNARMSLLAVKYDHDPIPKVSDAEIAEATGNLDFMYVQIPDAVVTLYSSPNGGIGMTATASTAQIVTPEK